MRNSMLVDPFPNQAAKRILSGPIDGVPDTRNEPKEPT